MALVSHEYEKIEIADHKLKLLKSEAAACTNDDGPLWYVE
jgi:hypothetical protein